MPCKEQREKLRNEFWLYRFCTASFDPKLSHEVIRDGGKRKGDFEPSWQDEKDCLCIVEFSPTYNPETRLFSADIIG